MQIFFQSVEFISIPLHKLGRGSTYIPPVIRIKIHRVNTVLTPNKESVGYRPRHMEPLQAHPTHIRSTVQGEYPRNVNARVHHHLVRDMPGLPYDDNSSSTPPCSCSSCDPSTNAYPNLQPNIAQ